MSYRRLDAKNKPLPRKGRTAREPATKRIGGRDHFHYEIVFAVSAGGGKRKYSRRHFWLPDDEAPEAKERELKFEAPADALTWRKAAEAYLSSKQMSAPHRVGITRTLDKWCASFGEGSTLEATTLAAFCSWLEKRKAGKTGRAAQLDYSHLMAVARWCRKRGMVEVTPFIEAPKPEAAMRKRLPAGVDEFRDMLSRLPEAMQFVWRMMGRTGMRLGAACTLRESRMTPDKFTVVTKGSQEVTYPMTPAIAKIIADARAWKAEKGFVTDCLFCNTHGAAWNNQSYGQQLRKVCDRLKIPRITSHQLRHLAGTSMGEDNLSAKVISAGLGHRSTKSSDVYISQTLEMRSMALQAVDKKLGEFDGKNIATNDMKNCKSGENGQDSAMPETPRKVRVTCPNCGHKYFISK